PAGSLLSPPQVRGPVREREPPAQLSLPHRDQSRARHETRRAAALRRRRRGRRHRGARGSCVRRAAHGRSPRAWTPEAARARPAVARLRAGILAQRDRRRPGREDRQHQAAAVPGAPQARGSPSATGEPVSPRTRELTNPRTRDLTDAEVEAIVAEAIAAEAS